MGATASEAQVTMQQAHFKPNDPAMGPIPTSDPAKGPLSGGIAASRLSEGGVRAARFGPRVLLMLLLPPVAALGLALAVLQRGLSAPIGLGLLALLASILVGVGAGPVWARPLGRAAESPDMGPKRRQMLADITAQRYDRLVEKHEDFGRRVGKTAHDFNNMLAILQGNIELLTFLELGSEAQPYLDQAQDSFTLGQRLVARLRDKSDRSAQIPVHLSLRAVLTGLKPLLVEALPPQIAVELAPGGPTGSVYVDRGDLEEALLQLVWALGDGAGPGGRLQLSLGQVQASDDDHTLPQTPPPPASGIYCLLQITAAARGHAVPPPGPEVVDLAERFLWRANGVLELAEPGPERLQLKIKLPLVEEGAQA